MSDRPTGTQVHAVLASYLGWTLDAFDFSIWRSCRARSRPRSPRRSAAWRSRTLACRAVGAVFSGRLTDRYGRRPTLMINVLCYSVLEFASGLAPSLAVLLVSRALYGVAMGGERGASASLTMESVPAKWRGPVSGLLRAVYPGGCLLASFFSHGSRDLYPSPFRGAEHHLAPGAISVVSIVANLGAMTGGIGFGTLSRRIGRK